MAQIINTNTMSLNAQRNLSTSGNSLATSIQRLSSGLRINSAKDDAAGLAISERFTTQIRGINQAARNANNGISLAQTAEGALGEIGNNLQRIRELAVQSRNATNSASDRQALNAEAQLLKAEIQRVSEQTNFNGTSLLNGSFTNQAFQIGADQGQTINISQIANANTNKLGSWTSASTPASVSGALPKTTTSTGASGEFTSAVATAADQSFSLSVGGVSILQSTSAAVGDEVDAADIDTALTTAKVDELEAKGITVSGSAATNDLAFAKADGSALSVALDSTYGTKGSFATEGFAGTHSGKFDAISGNQLTINGTQIDVKASASPAERATALVNGVNAKSHETGVTASLIDGQLQLTSDKGDITIAGTLATDADALLTATGLKAGVSGADAGGTPFAVGGPETGFAALDISSQADADNAILAMDAALQSVNSARADLGAIQNRFSSTVANLTTSSENMSAARSRIRDVDYAQETAELTRSQILQQAGTAMLAQANQVPQNVLSLLQS